MNLLGKTFGGMIGTGALLFAGVLFVTSMAEAVRGIWNPGKGKEADKDE